MKKTFKIFLALILLSFSLPLFGRDLVIVEQHFVCKKEDKMDSMPGSLAECDAHAILACWYGGSGPGRCNIEMKETGIWLSRYQDKNWSKPLCVYQEANNKCWNPVVANRGGGHFLLFFRIGLSPREARAVIMHSHDDGKSWTQPENLPTGIFGPTKSAPMISENLWICPSSLTQNKTAARSVCFLDITKDDGKSWKKYGPIEPQGEHFGMTEPSMFQDAMGNLQLFFRNRAGKSGAKGYVYTATFFPELGSFSQVLETSLPNPDSGIDCRKLKDGRVAIVYNDSFKERFPLVLSLSTDEGKTWGEKIALESTPGEFSQPSILQSQDGRIHILYAYQPSGYEQKCIKHVVLVLRK